MGYYTYYNLQIKGVETEERFLELSRALEQMGLIKYVFDIGNYDNNRKEATFYSYESVKWYEYNDDMKNLSLIFPSFTFCLEGQGEEYDDIWRAYYKYGEDEFCPARIIFEEPVKIKWEQS